MMLLTAALHFLGSLGAHRVSGQLARSMIPNRFRGNAIWNRSKEKKYLARPSLCIAAGYLTRAHQIPLAWASSLISAFLNRASVA
jgi:hypothetical protein